MGSLQRVRGGRDIARSHLCPWACSGQRTQGHDFQPVVPAVRGETSCSCRPCGIAEVAQRTTYQSGSRLWLGSRCAAMGPVPILIRMTRNPHGKWSGQTQPGALSVRPGSRPGFSMRGVIPKCIAEVEEVCTEAPMAPLAYRGQSSCGKSWSQRQQDCQTFPANQAPPSSPHPTPCIPP